MVIAGGDGSFKGAQKLAHKGMNVIGIPCTIDGDISCSDYTIGFDTAVNTAMRAIDNIRDTASSHEKCSMIEVMGRNAGYIALWCGIANGAESVVIPETYDYNEVKIMKTIAKHRENGKKNNIIINAEGVYLPRQSIRFCHGREGGRPLVRRKVQPDRGLQERKLRGLRCGRGSEHEGRNDRGPEVYV